MNRVLLYCRMFLVSRKKNKVIKREELYLLGVLKKFSVIFTEGLIGSIILSSLIHYVVHSIWHRNEPIIINRSITEFICHIHDYVFILTPIVTMVVFSIHYWYRVHDIIVHDILHLKKENKPNKIC